MPDWSVLLASLLEASWNEEMPSLFINGISCLLLRSHELKCNHRIMNHQQTIRQQKHRTYSTNSTLYRRGNQKFIYCFQKWEAEQPAPPHPVTDCNRSCLNALGLVSFNLVNLLAFRRNLPEGAHISCTASDLYKI